MPYDLFNPLPDNSSEISSADDISATSVGPDIEGLSYIREFITREEEANLLESIDASHWLTDLKRRVQHYGYKYDYKRRSLDHSMYIGAIPNWAASIAERIVQHSLMRAMPDQVIVNEYLPGQGISDHVDCEPCFDDTIISLSLASGCIMEFKKLTDKGLKKVVYLAPRSLVVLKGESRYGWTHGIPAREKDKWHGRSIPRKRRVSLTYRKVILENQ
jgi:alkylated DNA repair dioxygenase AlkB